MGTLKKAPTSAVFWSYGFWFEIFGTPPNPNPNPNPTHWCWLINLLVLLYCVLLATVKVKEYLSRILPLEF